MLKTPARLAASLALAALMAAPATARETRSGQSVTSPERIRGSEVSRERLALVLDVAVAACDAPGKGNGYGHEKGRGNGHNPSSPGKGHACDGASPG